MLDTFAPCLLDFSGIGTDSVAKITAFAIIYGFTAGAYVFLIPLVIVELTPDMTVVGTWLGTSLSVAAFGLLLGTPIAGSPVNIGTKQFVAAHGFTGGVILIGASLMLMALVIQARKMKSWKIWMVWIRH